MKRIAEIIYVVPEERDAYFERYANPSPAIQKILWNSGIRRQVHYLFDQYILRTFAYAGNHFNRDMEWIKEQEATKDFFLKNRRRDIPADQLNTSNWWVPLKWGGETLLTDPTPESDLSDSELYRSMTSGTMADQDDSIGGDFDYSEDDWSESVHM